MDSKVMLRGGGACRRALMRYIVNIGRSTFPENASCPLFGPADTLTDGSLGHVDIHAPRVLHQE